VAQAAQERKSPLAGAPAIRKRVELRDKRFELGAGAAATLGQDFYNAVFVNLRAGFHITDSFGLSLNSGVFNLTPDMKTDFHSQLAKALGTSGRLPNSPNPDPTDKTPTPDDAAAAANRISMFVIPQLDVVPFTGKLALFSKLFMSYDVYVFGGVGAVNLVKKGQVDPNYCGPDPTDQSANPAPRCAPYAGMKLAGSGGVGMHAFVNDYFAINLEVRDLIYKNNASGRDVNGDGVTDKHDLNWTWHNWLIGLNATFFLPAKAKISH
jgi:outer membrane beta-barrel protein